VWEQSIYKIVAVLFNANASSILNIPTVQFGWRNVTLLHYNTLHDV